MLHTKITKDEKQLRAYPSRQAKQTSGSTADIADQIRRAARKMESAPVSAEIEWDQFVSSHCNALIYHQTAWKHVIEESFPHIHGSEITVRDPTAHNIIAALPVYLVKSWLLGDRIVSIPFAPIGDPLISNSDDFNKLLGRLQEFQKRTDARRTEIRSTTATPILRSLNLVSSSNYAHHYFQITASLDGLFRKFSRNVRRIITAGQKNGIDVGISANWSDLQQFYELLTANRRKMSLPALPRGFFEAIWRYFIPTSGKLFLAHLNGKVIGGLLVLHSDKTWVAEYICNSVSAYKDHVMHLLYWEAIKTAHAKGAGIFSFGRTSRSNPRLIAHKRKWGTIEDVAGDFRFCFEQSEVKNCLPQGRRDSQTSYRLIKFLCKVAPVPLYKKLSDFCYSHMG
jgi:hypothetical protein